MLTSRARFDRGGTRAGHRGPPRPLPAAVPPSPPQPTPPQLLSARPLDRHLLLSAAEALGAATADLALLAGLADEPALLSDVLVLLDAIDREDATLTALLVRHRD